MTSEQAIKEEARKLGFDDCRITTAEPPPHGEHLESWLKEGMHAGMEWMGRNADKRRNLALTLDNVQSIITLAVSYAREGDLQSNPEGTRRPVARYARFEDYHDVLSPALKDLSAWVENLCSCRTLWYVDTGPVMERDLAQRAGLGFTGKHTNLIHRHLGNWFFIAEILTTTRLEADAPQENRCGRCTRCIVACPTQAIVAPFRLDSRRCISYWTIEHKGLIPESLRPLIGHRVFGCDDCLEACPWNRFARVGALMKPHFKPELDQVDLLDWLALSPAEFRQRFQGTPLFRTRRRRLLRNVCVVLGNCGNVDALPQLQQAAEKEDPLIAEHAEWAVAQIKARTRGA